MLDIPLASRAQNSIFKSKKMPVWMLWCILFWWISLSSSVRHEGDLSELKTSCDVPWKCWQILFKIKQGHLALLRVSCRSDLYQFSWRRAVRIGRRLRIYASFWLSFDIHKSRSDRIGRIATLRRKPVNHQSKHSCHICDLISFSCWLNSSSNAIFLFVLCPLPYLWLTTFLTSRLIVESLLP